MQNRRIQRLALSGFLLSCGCGVSLASQDLLLDEQWGLHNTPRLATAATSTGTTTGTCANKPLIDAGQYTCETYLTPGVDDMDINAPEGWALYSPSPLLAQQDVVIALIDTGIDYLHPDLKDRIWLNPGEATGQDSNSNGVDDGCEDDSDGDHNGYLNDCHGINALVSRTHTDGTLNPQAGDPLDDTVGHGTNMAGVMAAASDNPDNAYFGGIVGVAGIEPRIRIATCKSGTFETDALPLVPGTALPVASETAIRQCLEYFHTLKMAGVNIAVVNASGGMSHHLNFYGLMYPLVNEKYWLDTPAMQALANQLENDDILVVAASGNNGWNIDQTLNERAYFPAAFRNENIIAVGAIDNQGDTWSGSSYGRWTVDVLAPGAGILSTSPHYPLVAAEYADFIVSDGTSQATAYVSGMAALIRANAGTAALDAKSVRRLLLTSGKPLSGAASKTASGRLVRLADLDGRGALTCHNQILRRRQLPQGDAVVALPGTTLTLEMQNFNCAQPGSETALPVTITPGNLSLTLRDDGAGADHTAGDGIYSARWTVPAGEYEYHLATGLDSVTGATDVLRVKAGIIVDNTDSGADYTGKWWPSFYRSGYYGSNYRYATENEPEKIFTWSPLVAEAGQYQVYARWPQGPNFATQALFRIHHSADGGPLTTRVTVDQTGNGNQWMNLGLYLFDAGLQTIELSNLNADGTVVADAIMLVPVP